MASCALARVSSSSWSGAPSPVVLTQSSAILAFATPWSMRSYFTAMRWPMGAKTGSVWRSPS
eukprot:1731062-Lingulodinium_polyedra.AAC.1